MRLAKMPPGGLKIHDEPASLRSKAPTIQNTGLSLSGILGPSLCPAAAELFERSGSALL